MKSAAPSASASRWLRWSIAAVCALAGASSVASTLANAIVRGDAERANTLPFADGRVAAAAAQAIYAKSPSRDDNSPAVVLARKALASDATAVDALTLLAFHATLNNRTEKANKLYAQTIRLSRRDLRSRIWAIEDSVNRGDIRRALANYDIALRTSSDAPNLLFPSLSAALVEPKIREELSRLLSKRPAWAENFFAYLASTPLSPVAAKAFFDEAPGYGVRIGDEYRTQLVDQLVGARAFDEAFALYSALRSGVVRTASRDPDFSQDVPGRTAFDWNAESAPGISAAIVPNEADGVADFFAAAQTGGVVLKQMQLLPPGRYTLRGSMSGINGPQRTRPYWILRCETGLELGRADLASDARSFSGTFAVPKDCAVQMLELIARPTDSIDGTSGRVLRAALTRDQ